MMWPDHLFDYRLFLVLIIGENPVIKVTWHPIQRLHLRVFVKLRVVAAVPIYLFVNYVEVQRWVDPPAGLVRVKKWTTPFKGPGGRFAQQSRVRGNDFDSVRM